MGLEGFRIGATKIFENLIADVVDLVGGCHAEDGGECSEIRRLVPGGEPKDIEVKSVTIISVSFVDHPPWVVENLQKDREIFWFFVHMDALAPIGLVRVSQLRLLDHICENHGTTTEMVGVDAEEQGPTHEDDVTGSQVKLRMLRCNVAFVWRWDVGIDERRASRPIRQRWGAGQAEVRAVYPPFQVQEENVLSEVPWFSLCVME